MKRNVENEKPRQNKASSGDSSSLAAPAPERCPRVLPPTAAPDRCPTPGPPYRSLRARSYKDGGTPTTDFSHSPTNALSARITSIYKFPRLARTRAPQLLKVPPLPPPPPSLCMRMERLVPAACAPGIPRR
jgi:hypothetical protein